VGENSTLNNNNNIQTTMNSLSNCKCVFHQKVIDVFEKMAQNSTNLMKHFEKTNCLLERINYQMDHLIEKP